MYKEFQKMLTKAEKLVAGEETTSAEAILIKRKEELEEVEKKLKHVEEEVEESRQKLKVNFLS